jgi:hypothetical protein
MILRTYIFANDRKIYAVQSSQLLCDLHYSNRCEFLKQTLSSFETVELADDFS